MTYHILDKRFVYTPAAKTDISKTFERVKRQQLMKHMPVMYAPIPGNWDEEQIAEAYKLMHQDLDNEYPWGN